MDHITVQFCSLFSVRIGVKKQSAKQVVLLSGILSSERSNRDRRK